MGSGSFVFSGKHSFPIEDGNPSSDISPPLYQTARVFPQWSSYDFETIDNGTYLVRLHFYAFSSPTDLSKAVFNVSASGSSLIQNFSGRSSRSSPVIKEFLISIDVGRFVIYFTPSQESSLAFVNAIEYFPAPLNIPDHAPRITLSGRNNSYKGMLSQILHTIYRINVGGPQITPENDTLWRNWLPNKSYIYDPNTAINSPVHTGELNYLGGKATKYIAPDFVYQTALEMNTDYRSQSKNFNITWCFNVSKSARHFVRAHFCDIVSETLYVIDFNLYIFSYLVSKIDSQKEFNMPLDAPFYIDFVVDSDGSGLLNISIGPREDSVKNTAFLNGLEIMEMIGELVLVPTANKSEKKHAFVLLGSVVGVLGFIFILVVSFSMGLKRWKKKRAEILDWSPLYGGASPLSRLAETSRGSPVPNLNLGLKVSLAEILFVTKNFDKKLVIGHGGFGKVYRGTLGNGQKVAVKRSEPGLGQGRLEFQTEVLLLSKIRYRHLVSLIAYCDEGDEMILVYEFMEKGTLRDHLYESSFSCLSWQRRLEICIGAARGLHYLHTGAARGIIHRDVKSSNILLDENFVAKVADFGLSRSIPLDQTHVSTCVKGSIGYLDPEYMRSEQLTEKSDIYSFGVVLLEVLCARPAIDPSLSREQVNLAEWGMFWQKQGLLEQIVDPLLVGDINPNSLRKFGETAEKCLREYGADRPAMGDVLWDLEYALQLQQSSTPRQPHEDSATDAASMFPPHSDQQFPSISLSTEKGDFSGRIGGDRSDCVTTGVFSLLSADDGKADSCNVSTTANGLN
ncbi:probable receptor-like protein kinase At5g24010 isoform X2 [Malania oleifera]|nr:probable receptor-like protein kinase At5g24010 isoform X2 [Malania oleifera]